MAAFGQLERLLLRAAGARLTPRRAGYRLQRECDRGLGSGGGLGHRGGLCFRDFRRGGADAWQASIALAVAGVFSAVAFAVIAALGVALTGNPAAAVLALAGGAAGAALVAVPGQLAVRRGPRSAGGAGGRGGAGSAPGHGPSAPGRGAAAWRRVAAGRVRCGLATGRSRWPSGARWSTGWRTCAAWSARCWRWVSRCPGRGSWWPGPRPGAASFSPVPGGIGVVEVVLIAALVGVGVRAPAAVATTLGTGS